MTSTPRILMCPPDHFAIEYEINAWMDRRQQAIHDSAVAQWSNLRQWLKASGAKIELLPPVPGLPDLVFTANAALVYGQRVVLSRFRHEVRQREVPHDRAWFEAAGFEIIDLPEDIYFEGAGDALFCGDTLFAGYRIRSDARGHQYIGGLLGCRVIPLELVNPHYYHLDTCFCPLEPGRAIYYPAAFDEYGQQVLRTLVDDLIEVSPDEASHFACNAVVVGRTVITNSNCPDLHRQLAARGFTCHGTPLGEFVKSGGSAKCLTLRLDGEEAAGWKLSQRATLSGD